VLLTTAMLVSVARMRVRRASGVAAAVVVALTSMVGWTLEARSLPSRFPQTLARPLSPTSGVYANGATHPSRRGLDRRAHETNGYEWAGGLPITLAAWKPANTPGAHPDSMQHKTVALFARYGVWATFGAILMEGMGIPLPGQTLLIGGVLWQAPRGGAWGVIVGAWLAAVVGNSLGYAIGSVLRRRLATPHPRISKITSQIRRRGATFVLLARFVDGARQLNGIAAGLVDLPFRRFMLFNAAGALLWVGVWSAVAWWAADHADRVGGLLHSHRIWMYALALMILTLAGIAFRRRHARDLAEP